MKKKIHNGFSIVELLVIVMVVSLIVGAGFFIKNRQDGNKSVDKENQQESAKQSKKSGATEPKIFNLGLSSLDDIDITANATRDFKKSGHKGFYIFGDILPGNPVRYNPNFEFSSVKEGVPLVSAIDGIVGFIKEQEGASDYEVFLMTEENSPWVIGYDHVSDVKVKKGDKVKVGDILGYPTRQGNGLLRFEFQINKDDGSKDGVHVCPVTLFDSSVQQKWIEQLRNSQEEWETTTNLELYDQASQEPVGCLQKQMTPAFAQGNE